MYRIHSQQIQKSSESHMKFAILFWTYFERHTLPDNRNPEVTMQWWRYYGKRWADFDVSEITPRSVQCWFDDMTSTSPAAATRAVNMLAAIITWGNGHGHINMDNPTKGIERFKIKSRRRFLLPAELKRFCQALDLELPIYRDFFWLCLLTGARRGNVLAMRWDQVDIDLAIWQFDSKNNDVQCAPLSTAALAVLQRRKLAVKDSPWVFPSHGSHLQEPRRVWKRILIKADLDNLRIHDLRRTVGSYLAIKGYSSYLIGEVLGHRDPRSTAVYARLFVDPVRAAIEDIQASWLSMASKA